MVYFLKRVTHPYEVEQHLYRSYRRLTVCHGTQFYADTRTLVRVNRKDEILPQWRGTEFLSYKHKTLFYADTRTLVRVNRTVHNRPQCRFKALKQLG